MVIDGAHFEYGSYSSALDDLIFAHIDTSNFQKISGDIGSSTIFNKRNKRRYMVGSDYSNYPVEMEVEIITADLHFLSKTERRRIEKALFYKPTYYALKIHGGDDCLSEGFEIVNGQIKKFFFRCRFTNPEKIELEGGNIVGYKCVMECDSGLMTQEDSSYTYTTKSFTVNVDDDTNDYVYPQVTIVTGTSGGDITIKNTTDSTTRVVKFAGLGANATIVMDGRINFITDGYYTKLVDQNFIRLLDGANDFTITGDVRNIKFVWNNKRYM